MSLNVIQKRVKTQTDIWKDLNRSDRLNKRRLIRILEKAKTGTLDIEETQNKFINHTFYYPNYDWDQLKKKIESRAIAMFEEGLIEETKLVLDKYGEDAVALKGIGFREVVLFLKGKIYLKTCKEKVVISHRQYARRQRTWFEGKRRAYKFKYF